jgi:hypothetical protein
VTQQVEVERPVLDDGTDVRKAIRPDVPAETSPVGTRTTVRPAPAPAPGPRPAAPPAPAATPDDVGQASWLPALGVLVIGMFMSILDTSIVNVALPTVQLELGISATDGQWVSTAYSLAEGVMVPISAWLGYRYGPKKIYILCLAGSPSPRSCAVSRAG